MDRRAVLEALGLPTADGVFATEWADAMAARPDEAIPFLTTEFVTDACRTASLPADVRRNACRAARRIAATEELRSVSWYLHYCLFVSESFEMYAPPLHASGLRDWPDAEAFAEAVGDDRGFVYLLAVLSGLPTMRTRHRERALPDELTEREIADVHDRIQQRVGAYRDDHGVAGLDRKGCYWISISLRAEIFRLGRLRFQFGRFRPSESLVRLHAFRHDRTGEVIALSADGVRYHPDGQLAPSEPSDDQPSWTADLERTADMVRGYPIDPKGVAVREPIDLPTADWSEVFGPTVRHLRIHIPGDGPMTFAACGDSFERALEFFPRYFPDRPFDAFVCTSWLLDTQLQELLSDASNMVRFQRELYLFPTFRYAPDDRRLARRILDPLPADPDPSAGETSLEVALLERLAAGDELRSRGGGGFLLPSDLDWGARVYQQGDRPWHHADHP